MSEVAVLQNNPTSLFPSESEWKMLKEQAEMVVKTGFLPSAVNTPEKAITIALKGRELGIPPMQAYSHIHVIQGKPTISSELMLSLIYRNCPGAKINYILSTSEACEIEATRPGHSPYRFKFTILDAQNAKLTNKDNWRNFPAAMLRARTIAILARAVFPDAIMGCSYTPEELGAEIDEEGRVVDVPNDATPPLSKDKAPSSKEETPKIVAPRTRGSVGVEIMNAGSRLGLAKAQTEEWAKEFSGKTPAQMNLEEMEKFLVLLQEEIGRGEISHDQ